MKNKFINTFGIVIACGIVLLSAGCIGDGPNGPTYTPAGKKLPSGAPQTINDWKQYNSPTDGHLDILPPGTKLKKILSSKLQPKKP